MKVFLECSQCNCLGVYIESIDIDSEETVVEEDDRDIWLNGECSYCHHTARISLVKLIRRLADEARA